MSPVKTAYVPRFGSQSGSSQRDEPQPSPSQTVDRNEPASRCRKKKRANKRARGENLQSPLKVKLPQFSDHRLSKKKARKGDGKTPGGRMLEPAASKPRTPVAPVTGAGDSQGAGTVIDAFFFSQTPTSKAADQKKKVKLTVLRTIAKMLEENQLIRQRLIALSQAQ